MILKLLKEDVEIIYGITPLYKYKRGNKRPEQIAYSREEAEYKKNSLERADGITYIIFEIKN